MTQEIFVDGLTSTMISGAVCRLSFHRTESVVYEDKLPVEQRRLLVTVAMPTAAVIQMCSFLIQQMLAAHKPMIANIDHLRTFVVSLNDEQLAAELKRLTATPEPGN